MGGVGHGRDTWMRCRDGTRLLSRIWQPAGDGPWPVLLMRQPYGRAIASTPVLAHPGWFASHGFLVVVQDVRGQGESEGEFGGFSQEASDTSDTVRWARQLPGSNGRLGSYGFSYQGFSQLVSDGGGDALPDCLAVAMAGLDERLHWASSGGAHWWALGLGWGLQLAALRCRRHGDQQGWQAIRSSLSSGRFLEEGIGLLERHDPDGMALTWLRQDPASGEPWIHHQPAPALWQRPLLLLGGWHDPHLEGVLDLWRRARLGDGAPLLRIGAWSHLNWGEGADQLHLDFFRAHLQPPASAQGANAAADPAPVLLQWERSGPWHPPGAVLAGPTSSPHPWPQQWWLSCDGQATAEGGGLRSGDGSQPAGGAPIQWLVHDPWRPVPGRGGHLDLNPGPCERSDLDERRDVACFSSEPLEWPLEAPVVRPRLRLRVSADQPGFDLCAALSTVGADGRVLQLAVGMARHRGEGCRESRWRQVDLQPLALRLRPGERLRLSLSAAAWPQIAVNPGNGQPPTGGSGMAHRVISLRLELDQACLEFQPALDAGDAAGELLGQTGPT
jgi:putative CocE/NonD family hydrolase